MNVVKNKLKEYERSRYRHLRYLLSLDADFLDENNLPEELVSGQTEPQGESVLEIIEWVLTPEELRLLKRLVFDRASHQQVAQEFGISVYASQKRLERIRDKLYAVFPERKRRKKKATE